MTTRELNYKSTNEGFCRVYYNMAIGGKAGKGLYCFQLDSNKPTLKSYGSDTDAAVIYETDTPQKHFHLYVCSKDGEPEYRINIHKISSIQLPPTDTETQTDLIKFLEELKK